MEVLESVSDLPGPRGEMAFSVTIPADGLPIFIGGPARMEDRHVACAERHVEDLSICRAVSTHPRYW